MKKLTKKQKRGLRVSNKITGIADRPRVSVYRSNKNVYAQIIDDESGKTLVGVSSKKIAEKGTKTEIAFELGKMIAKAAAEKKITKVVFDRGSSKYHGRVKAVAEGAREGGLEF